MGKGKVNSAEGKKGKPVYFVDYEFLIILIFLVCFGLVMLYSAISSSDPFFKTGDGLNIFEKQVIFTAAGFFGMYLISKIDYHLYGKAAPFLYLLSLALMFLVGIRHPSGGADADTVERALEILPGSGISFAPSDPAKIAVIIFAAYLICRVSKKIDTPKVFWLILILSGITGLWVKSLTTNLSTAIIVAAIPVLMLFVVHPRVMPFALLVLVILALAGGIITYVRISDEKGKNQGSKEAYISSEEEGEAEDAKKSYQFERIRSWVLGSPEGTYQVRQGMYAIGSGGFWGKGLGKSDQKLEAVPLVKNDMILTVVCEELGIFGAGLVLALFGYLLFRLMFIANNAPDMFGALIVIGVFIHIALQVVLNYAVVTNIIPTTGITLPFFSSGGSALLSTFGEMGIVWGISRKIVLE